MLAKTKMVGVVMALMALSVPLVYADNGGEDNHGGGWHHGQPDHMFAKVLNLTDDQQKQMKDSWEKNKGAMKSLWEQMKANRESLNEEITKTTPDMNKVNDIQAQMKILQSQMVDNQLSAIMEIKKIMTPEQFAGYMALKKERKLKMRMMGHEQFEHKHGMMGHDGHENWGDGPDHEDKD